MGYIFFLLAVFAGLAKGYYGKKTSDFVTRFEYALLASKIRIFWCVIFGAILLLPEIYKNGFSVFVVDKSIWLICVCSGVITAGVIMLWLIIVRQNAFCLLEIFSLMGVLLPVVLSGIIYDEKVKTTQWLCLAILFVAVFLISSYSSQTRTKFTFAGISLLVIFALLNGLSDFMQKTFSNVSKGEVSVSFFNFFTYVVAFLFMRFIQFFVCKKDNKSEKIVVEKRMYCYVVIMAIMLYFNTFFKTLCANYLTAVHIYPVYQGMILVFSTIMGAIFFKEKITIKNSVGILLVLMALFAIYLN